MLQKNILKKTPSESNNSQNVSRRILGRKRGILRSSMPNEHPG